MITQMQIFEVEPGYSYIVERTQIIDGVYLEVFKQPGYEDDAILYIGDNEILFKWNEEAQSIFFELDTCEPIELLTILAQAPKV
ncbi:hypothetical protein [Lysinibacillus pakistanensis]|uniref:Uncharacterized protein n=1 Tax=Lysinibacillus pakistanensis TaxID=759811 RepID=A0AAX3WTB3_9BACI|nr:hypothetical protein [Lysinibacillus pakistanensis]MDM5234258.1 hypothetical protein [Lysinibacillus pakistanensis]WHY44849.1 hypothetical protein QNH22_16175 [Lysinibacillus pakistanensis]WHY49856.1 hypothetical protein QNH24_16140 [Lysinibacillus pakistanensis]